MSKVDSRWLTKDYYKFAHNSTWEDNHPVYQVLGEIARSAKSVLEVGCGDGSKLARLVGKNGDATGIDISSVAIKMAKKKYRKLKFVRADAEKLPFKNSSFELVYSVYTLEHLREPDKVIEECIRVLRKDGKLVFVAPNYGSPNRRSPNSREFRIRKLLKGLNNDFFGPNLVNGNMGWLKVEPQEGKYYPDVDTTTEPYALTLVNKLKKLGVRIEKVTTLWQLDNFAFFQLPFRLLGGLGVYPFLYWGPQLMVVGKK